MAELVFEFVQFLLDDDANLTPAGNLTGAARQLLRKRVDELIAAEEAGTPSSAEDSAAAIEGTATADSALAQAADAAPAATPAPETP